MAFGLDSILVLVLLVNLFVLAASRIRTIVLAVAFQGVLLGLLAPVLHQAMGWREVLVGLGALALKGLVVVETEQGTLISPRARSEEAARFATGK